MGQVAYVRPPLPQDGYFDRVATIFARHAHPIIVLERWASRWMGMPCMPSRVSMNI
jgi:hypothetical protein